MLSMDVGTAVEIHVVCIVCVSRFRIWLGVGYVHVKSIDYLRRDFEHAHWDTFTDGACGVRKTRPHLTHLN